MTQLFENIRAMYLSPDFSQIAFAQALVKGELRDELRPYLKTFAVVDKFIAECKHTAGVTLEYFYPHFLRYPCIRVIVATDKFSTFVQTMSEDGAWYSIAYSDLLGMHDLETVADFYGKIIELV